MVAILSKRIITIKLTVGLGLGLLFVCFCHSFPLLFASVVLGLVSSVQSLGIGWEEHLQNDLFCVMLDTRL